MTKQEYHDLINKMITEPDSATVTAQSLLSEIDKDSEQLESLRSANADYEKRVRDLQDTNIKLFLSQTGQKSDPDPEPEEMSLQDFAHKLVSPDKEGDK